MICKLPLFLLFHLLCAISLSGCLSGPFSGSGAMRIEVEVYKGPLAEEPEIQWAKLRGYLDEAHRTIVNQANFSLAVLTSNGYSSIGEEIAPINVDKIIGEEVTSINADEIKGKSYPHLLPRYLYLPVDKSDERLKAGLDDFYVKDDPYESPTIPKTELLANDDTDRDGNSLRITEYTQPPNGTIRDAGYGNLAYTQKEKKKGIDFFRYVANDGKDGSVRGTVFLLIGQTQKSPTLILSGKEARYITNAPPIRIDPTGDVLGDSKFLNEGATLTVFLDNGMNSDLLSIVQDRMVKITNNEISIGKKKIGTFSEGNVREPLEILFEKDISHTQVKTLLQNIGFSNNSDNAATSTQRIVSFFLNDPIVGPSKRASKKITVLSTSAPQWCPKKNNWQQDYFDCVILRSLYFENLDLLHATNTLLTEHHDNLHKNFANNKKVTEILMDASTLGSRLSAKGFQWSVSSTAGQSMNIKVRIAVGNFIVGVTEYGNQLSTRADALLKQRHPDGRDRRELSLSAHLRDTEPTDFLHLYDWLDASISSFRYELPSWFNSGFWPNNIADRIKVVDRIFSDHYWSKINTVYASGKGKVSLAFVKDGIGNWDLKNFDNAPGELLQAYQNFSLSLIKKAGEIAAASFTGGGSVALEGGAKGASEILGVVGQYFDKATEAANFSQAPPTMESLAQVRLKALGESTAFRIKSLADQGSSEGKTLKDADLKKHQIATLNNFKSSLTNYMGQIEQFDVALKAANSKGNTKATEPTPPTENQDPKAKTQPPATQKEKTPTQPNPHSEETTPKPSS